ncbi:hypothetical protein LXA43DRAFT_903124 [Ganoderma leucocontextum]|nr:hypothetical protein LXA43DRAFT_903124 [Ganoderma leucocontextum]
MTPPFCHVPYTASPLFTEFSSDHASIASIQYDHSVVHSAATRTRYLYASSNSSLWPSYPVPPGYHRIVQQDEHATAGCPTETALEMPRSSHCYTPIAMASTSGIHSPSGREDSSQCGEGTSPPGGSHPPKKSNKKTHPCCMCYKSFDRQVTLKKHLTVHTGERAFACQGCGRRFGIESNRNRHANRCRVAYATTTGSGTSAEGNSPRNSNSTSSSPSKATSRTSSPTILSREANTGTSSQTEAATTVGTVQHRPARKHKSTEEGPQSPTATAPEGRPRSRKRARDASPVLWVPESLQMFDLTPMTEGAPVPLPPVRPSPVEERNSFDETVSLTPYHPQGWKGHLPGPGLLPNNPEDVRGGRILIFDN